MNGPDGLNNVDAARRLHNNLTSSLARSKRGNADPDIVMAASMCWTKAYSREAMQIYVDALESFLERERGGWERFFGEHPSYDDFIDYYVLLRRDITLASVKQRTHVYKKHGASITGNPSVGDFLYHRTAALITLIDLSYCDSAQLVPEWKSRLFRHVSIKTMFIEGLLAKYRGDFERGDSSKAAFSEKTHNGYFINKFCRMATGRRKQDASDDLFRYESTSRGASSEGNFCNLFSCSQINSIQEYRPDFGGVEYADSRYILQVAVDLERGIIKPDGKKKEETEEELYAKYGIKDTPNKQRYKTISWIAWLFAATLPLAIGFSFLPEKCGLRTFLRPVWEAITLSNPNVKAAMVSLYGVIVTYLFKSRNDIRLLASEEQSQMKLYFSEFEDLIRHLEANLKVMIQIVKQIREKKLDYPAGIHLTNLAWPLTSYLFSDDFAKIINKERVDDFARLKVNLRNINNSSAWLAEFVRNERDPEKIIEAIEWEIARHFGYLVNFKYLKENGFHFAKQEELDKYINENHVRNSLTSLFMDYYSDESEDEARKTATRMDFVEKYITMYYDDRRMKRNVLVYKNSDSVR